MTWLEYLCIGVIALIVVAVGASAYTEAKSPKLELVKTEWSCTKTIGVTSTMFIKSGDVLVPVPTTHQECITYERNR